MAMSKQFSLLDFSISITWKNVRYNLPMGGAGSYLGSISVTKSTDNITTTVDATGSGVFNFSADHSGTVEIELSQVSDKINEIINKMANYYHSQRAGDWKNALVDITISKNGVALVDATSCMLTKMPDLSIQPEVQNRTFTFSAIEIRELQVAW